MSMKEYEVVHEIFNECANNQMRDVFFEEVALDDPEQFLYLLLSVSMILLREGKEELFFSDPTQPL